MYVQDPRFALKRVYGQDPRFVLKRVYALDPRFHTRVCGSASRVQCRHASHVWCRYAFPETRVSRRVFPVHAFSYTRRGSRGTSPPMVGDLLASVLVVLSPLVRVCPSSLYGHHGFSSSLRSVDSFGIADANKSI